ncbi:MAG: BamA/TamA family outer membrane protein [Balneolaceae bacterium]
MHKKFLKASLSFLKGATIWLLLFFSPIAFAQTETVTDSTSLAFLPALAYNSDLGLIGGGIINRFHYRQGSSPFYSYTSLSGLISTGGLASISLFHDKPNLFQSNLRITSEVYTSRILEDPYFGIGSYQKIPNSTSTTDKFYYFKSFSAGFDVSLRYPFKTQTTGNQLDLLTIVRFNYNTPWDNLPQQLISQEQPLGYNGGHSLYFGTGFIWEGRNSEFRPTSGQYLENSIKLGQTWLGSSYNNWVFKTDARNYISFYLLREITLANRFSFKHTAGDVPYWELAYVGDEETIRGYPSRRFLDDNAVFLNTELRTWLFNIDAIEAEFGGTLFFDVGRSFPNGESLQAIAKDLKYSFGFGGNASFFTPDFVLRADMGFSDEGMGIYFTAGYMF